MMRLSLLLLLPATVASAEEAPKATLQVVDHLQFGGVLVQPGGGRLVLRPDGALVPEGGGLLPAPPPVSRQARFRLTGPPHGAFRLKVDPPSAVMTAPGGGHARLVSFQASLPTAGGPDRWEGTFNAAGQAEVCLGGTLDVTGWTRGPEQIGTQVRIHLQMAGCGSVSEAFRVEVRLKAPLVLSCTGPLDFGGLLPGEGTFTVLPTGGHAATGAHPPMLFRGTPRPASLLLQGPPGADVEIRLPVQAFLEGAGAPLRVDGFSLDVPAMGRISEGGTLFHIGATLHVGTPAPRGRYQGTFQVSVNYR